MKKISRKLAETPQQLILNKPVIEVSNLFKIFSHEVRAVDGVSFSVYERGRSLPFSVRTAREKNYDHQCTSKATSGSARIAGYDIRKQPREVRCRICNDPLDRTDGN